MFGFSRPALICASACLLSVAACDRADERVERAQDVTSAALGQLLGVEPAPASDKVQLSQVTMDARAVRGQFAEADSSLATTARRPRYVIGSIVAKPRDIVEAVPVAELQRHPELAREGDGCAEDVHA